MTYSPTVAHVPHIVPDARRCEVKVVDEDDIEGWRYCRLLREEHEVMGYAISAETRTQLIDLLERVALAQVAGSVPTQTDAMTAFSVLNHVKAAPYVYGQPEDPE